MQKTKKQLLGFAGLAAVGIMTAVAYAMPAAAVEDVPPSAEGDVNVMVTIPPQAGSANIIYPTDKSTMTNPEFEVVYMYNEVSNVKVSIEYKDKDGKTVTKLLESFSPAEPYSSGERKIAVNLLDYSEKDGDYKIILEATNINGAHASDDIVSFNYRAISTSPTDPADNGDPEIDIVVNDEIDKVVIQVYDKDGKPVLVDKDGNQTPIIVGREDIDENGKVHIRIPLEEYDVPSGEYEAVFVGYNKGGDIVSTDIIKITYVRGEQPTVPGDPNLPGDPNAPETPPNTGFVIGDLNISRVDYLVTGLIVFGTVAGFALYLVYRKSRR